VCPFVKQLGAADEIGDQLTGDRKVSGSVGRLPIHGSCISSSATGKASRTGGITRLNGRDDQWFIQSKKQLRDSY
jgi:hypothetical protein